MTPPEAAHGVAFEVGKVDHEIVVGQVSADDILGKPGCILHGQEHRAVGVHDIDGGNAAVTALFDSAAMVGGVGAVAAIGGVTFHDIAVDELNEGCDKIGAQLIALFRFACADFDSHFALRLNAKCIEYSHQSLGGDFRCEIDNSGIGLRRDAAEAETQSHYRKKFT